MLRIDLNGAFRLPYAYTSPAAQFAQQVDFEALDEVAVNVTGIRLVHLPGYTAGPTCRDRPGADQVEEADEEIG